MNTHLRDDKMKKHLLVEITKALRVSEYIVGSAPIIFGIFMWISYLAGTPSEKLLTQLSFLKQMINLYLFDLITFSLLCISDYCLRRHLKIPFEKNTGGI